MPKTRRPKRTDKKKARKKRTFKKSVPWILPKGTPSSRAMATFRYSDHQVWSGGGTNSYGNIDLRLDSIFDPEYATSPMVTLERNGQMRYRDELSVLYRKYIVKGANVTVRFRNRGTTDESTAVVFGYYVPPDSQDSVPIDVNFVAEHPYILKKNKKQLGPIRGAFEEKKLTVKYSEKQLCMRNRINNNFSATGASPSWTTAPPIARFGLINIQADVNQVYDVFIDAAYVVELCEPNYVNIS